MNRILLGTSTLALLAATAIATARLPLQFDTPPSPAAGTVFTIAVGETLTFTVQASDPDLAEVIQIRGQDQIPAGAVMNPPLPVLGNPVSSTFSWTPLPGQEGTHSAAFAAHGLINGARAAIAYTIIVTPPPVEGLCSYTQGGWGAKPAGNNPGKLLANNFAAVFPAGIEIGIPGAAGKSLKFTSSTAVEKFLPAGGTPGVITADKTNPTGATGAGVLAGQVLALQINVSFSNAGVTPAGLGSLEFVNTGNANLDGQTVADVLAAANQVIGGGSLPAWADSISAVNEVVTDLNEAFDNCTASSWAKVHLAK
ncbi:MAG: hypothetical protein JNJ88_11300 [Planctomycetes bacterium]|nr:hypothetical protein [Planctomycetota bacterium]